MIAWLDYKPSPRRLSICLSQREQQNIAAQSVTPKYHHWESCFHFLFKCWKILNLLCFFQHTDWPLEWTTNHVKLWTYDPVIWPSNNLAIWQQSGSNLAIWEWQSCITATSNQLQWWWQWQLQWQCTIGTVVEIIYQGKPEGPNNKEHNHLPDYVVVYFPNLKLPTGIPPWDELHKMVSSTCWLFLYHLGKFPEKKKITKTWPCKKTKIQQRIAREDTSTPH